MIRELIATDNDGDTTILRPVLGVVFFAHGAHEMLGLITELIQEKDPAGSRPRRPVIPRGVIPADARR